MRRFRKTIREPDTLTRRAPRGPAAEEAVDLHGMTGEEAVRRLRTLIESGSARTVLAVHGKGEGVLRARARALLRGHPRVTEVRPGEAAGLPGGDGVTWFRIRR